MVVRTKEEARANFEAAVAFIPERYKTGVSKAKWVDAAASDTAEANYAHAISEAIAKKKRAAGVRKVGDEGWRSGAISKGAPIIGERIRAALGKWMSNWGPIYDQVVSVVNTLPPKTFDYKANITNRLMKVVETWKKGAGKL